MDREHLNLHSCQNSIFVMCTFSSSNVSVFGVNLNEVWLKTTIEIAKEWKFSFNKGDKRAQ